MKGEGSPTKWKESCESSFTYTKKRGGREIALLKGRCTKSFKVVLTQALEAPNVSHSVFVAPHFPDSNDW